MADYTDASGFTTHTVFVCNAEAVRQPLTAEEDGLQVMSLIAPVTTPHRHGDSIARAGTHTVEAWIPTQGTAQVELLDRDGTILQTLTLVPGMIVITYGPYGAHAISSSSVDFHMFEVKNGPFSHTRINV